MHSIAKPPFTFCITCNVCRARIHASAFAKSTHTHTTVFCFVLLCKQTNSSKDNNNRTEVKAKKRQNKARTAAKAQHLLAWAKSESTYILLDSMLQPALIPFQLIVYRLSILPCNDLHVYAVDLVSLDMRFLFSSSPSSFFFCSFVVSAFFLFLTSRLLFTFSNVFYTFYLRSHYT